MRSKAESLVGYKEPFLAIVTGHKVDMVQSHKEVWQLMQGTAVRGHKQGH